MLTSQRGRSWEERLAAVAGWLAGKGLPWPGGWAALC